MLLTAWLLNTVGQKLDLKKKKQNCDWEAWLSGGRALENVRGHGQPSGTVIETALWKHLFADGGANGNSGSGALKEVCEGWGRCTKGLLALSVEIWELSGLGMWRWWLYCTLGQSCSSVNIGPASALF